MRTLVEAVVVGATLSATASDGHAQAVTARQLLELCGPQASDASQEICLGYIIGSADALVVRGGICTPPGVTHGLIRDTVIKFMLNHPERLREPAIHLIFTAMAESFPCR
jgi:hypothetical protein